MQLDFRGRRKSVVPRLWDRPQVSARLRPGGPQLRASVSLKMADEEAGDTERMEVSPELPRTPQRLASVSPCGQVPFVPPSPSLPRSEGCGAAPLMAALGRGSHTD